MARQAIDTATGMRLALFAAALLLAAGAMLALAATATAQDPGTGSKNDGNVVDPSGDEDGGQLQGGSAGSAAGSGSADDDDDSQGQGGSAGGAAGSGSADDDDDDDNVPQDPCSGVDLANNVGRLFAFQDRYFARTPGSNKAGTDTTVAAIPQGDRLTDAERRCALHLQDERYPNLRWGFQTRCPRNHIYSFRPTGASLTIDGVEFRQWETIEDYECTSRWSALMTDGSLLPEALIPPAEPVSIITVKYRVRTWVQWSEFDRASVPSPPADESTLAEE